MPYQPNDCVKAIQDLQYPDKTILEGTPGIVIAVNTSPSGEIFSYSVKFEEDSTDMRMVTEQRIRPC